MRTYHSAGPMPQGWTPKGTLLLRITPCGGQPIEQVMEAWRFDPDTPGQKDELQLVVGEGDTAVTVRLRVSSWTPLRASGCGRTADGQAKVEVLSTGGG